MIGTLLGTIAFFIAFFAIPIGIVRYIPMLRRQYRERHPHAGEGRWFCYRCCQFVPWGSLKRNGHRYCSANCQQLADPIDFCAACLAETEPAPVNLRLQKLNQVGTGIEILRHFGCCSECSSWVCRVGTEAFGLSVGVGEFYRVIYLIDNEPNGPVILRRLKSTKS